MYYSKYPLLNDYEWLRQKAVTEKLSYSKIAKLANVKHHQSVCQALKRHRLFAPRRISPKIIGKSFYEELNNPEWLKQKYCIEKLSTIQIAKLIDANCGVVRQSLLRHNIPVRNKSEGHLYIREGDGFELNKRNLYIINGGLLGDATLRRNKNGKKLYGNPAYSKKSVCEDYIEYEAKLLFGEKWEDRISYFKGGEKVFDKYISKPSYALTSLNHTSLLPLFNKWYVVDEEGFKKKVIPHDIEIDKDTLLHWFMDDGYTYKAHRCYQNSKYNHEELRMYFCTQSFEKDELFFLVDIIYKLFSIKMTPRMHKRNNKTQGTGYEIEVKIKDVPLFYEVIGDCPVPSMQYKWK